MFVKLLMKLYKYYDNMFPLLICDLFSTYFIDSCVFIGYMILHYTGWVLVSPYLCT